MAKRLKPSEMALNVQANALAPLFDAGYFRVYSGSQPSDPSTPVGAQHKLLAELRFAKPAFALANNGVLKASDLTPENKAKAGGRATWFRCLASDGLTALLDGSIGESDCDLNLNSVEIQKNAEVWLPTLSYSVSK